MNDEELYNAMQRYRHTPIGYQEDVVKAYDVIKDYVASIRLRNERLEKALEACCNALYNRTGIAKEIFEDAQQALKENKGE